jgi:hypothetical protein
MSHNLLVNDRKLSIARITEFKAMASSQGLDGYGGNIRALVRYYLTHLVVKFMTVGQYLDPTRHLPAPPPDRMRAGP